MTNSRIKRRWMVAVDFPFFQAEVARNWQVDLDSLRLLLLFLLKNIFVFKYLIVNRLNACAMEEKGLLIS